MSDNRFSNGLLLGIILGGGAVFLLGTRTGKNLLKIISEQGLDGIVSVLDEYDLSEIEEDEEEDAGESPPTSVEEHKESNHTAVKETRDAEKEETPKKRFFRRVKR